MIKKIPYWTLALFALVVLVVGVLLWTDWRMKASFALVNTELERVRTEYLDPAGAIEWLGGTYTPYFRGNGLDLSCWPDAHCPSASRNWFVPIKPGDEEPFIKQTLIDMGYQITLDCATDSQRCGATGKKDGLEISIYFQAYEGNDAPAKDMSPKVWRLLDVKVYGD